MTNRWLQLVEAHVEKGILGLAALFMVGMLWMYLIKSPNSVDYQGQQRGPRELLEAIKHDADDLDRVVRNAKGEEPKVEKFSERLRRHHNEGIFAAAPGEGPALTPELTLAASFGRKIEVPGLKDTEGDAAGSIVLVTPLRPVQPKLRTGRSLAIREQSRIVGLDETPAATDEPPKSEEVAWVTVASYFNKKAQYEEMIKVGYAPYRSKAYVVGLDAQRQEILSTGEYSDWRDVANGKAMPKIELPEPQFDDQTGELINKDEIRQTFATVKEYQPELMQPPFYMVEAGDFWEIPALAGYEDDDEEEEEEEEALAAGPTRGRRTAAPGTTAGPTRGRPSGRGVTGRGTSRGRGGRGVSRGSRTGATPGAQDDADEKRAARKQIRADLTEAKKMLGKKEYEEARRLAERILGDAYASKGDIRNAKQIVKLAENWLEIQAERGGGTRGAVGRGGRSAGRTSGRGMAPTAARRGGPVSQREAIELIANPEKTDEVAVWFHDDTVEAGKTYRYRLRVKLWNRYVGRMRSMTDPEQAKQPIVAGDWSYPSEPITVTPSTYFFLSGSRPPDAANLDVWKWRGGRWFKQRFDVSIGDVIGGVRNIKTGEYDAEGEEVRADVKFTTGAVVLDLRINEQLKFRWPGKNGVFSYRDKTSTVMTYLDPADGQVKERVLIFDRSDPKNKELKDEAW